MFKKLAEKLKNNNLAKSFSPATSPFDKDAESLKNLSRHALGLYERQSDINNFKKLVLSDPENQSHNEIVDNLFKNQGVPNPFSDEALFELSENKRFLEDLGL
jgi:hypothetical protein